MDSLINLLQKGLEGASLRQETLINNIANVNTPGYKRADVDFFSILKKEVQKDDKSGIIMKTTDERHITTDKKERPFKRLIAQNTSYRNDKNNVDIEYEMAELSKTELYYITLAQYISRKFSSLNNVIEKGGKY